MGVGRVGASSSSRARSGSLRPVTTTRCIGRRAFASASVVGSSLPPPSPPAMSSATVVSCGRPSFERSSGGVADTSSNFGWIGWPHRRRRSGGTPRSIARL